MIISTATKSLCKRCNADMKEKLACEIYKLITTSGLLLVFLVRKSVHLDLNPVSHKSKVPPIINS